MGVPLSAVAAMMQSSPPDAAPTITRLRLPDRDYMWIGGLWHLVIHLRITPPPGATEIGWRRWVSSGGGPIGRVREPDPPPARPFNWRTVAPDGHVYLLDLPDPPSYIGWRIRAWGASGSRMLGPHADSGQF